MVIFVIMIAVLLVRPAGPVRSRALRRADAAADRVVSLVLGWASSLVVLGCWSRRGSSIRCSWSKMLCYALFACAFNLLLGTCGLMSFGHAAFFGSAAYVAGHAAKVWGLPFEAAIASAGRGACAARRRVRLSSRSAGRACYFAMITLALAQLIYFLALQLPFTHAEDGLTGMPRGKVLGLFALDDNLVLYYTDGRHLPRRVQSASIVITHSTFGQVVRVDPRQRDARDLARLRG